MQRVAALLIGAALTACGAGAGTSDEDRSIRVVAGFAPLAEAAQRLGGDHVDVTNLTSSGGEPHDLELTTTQLDAVLDADLVVYAGRGFQPALEEVVRERDGAVVDVLEDIDLLEGDEGPDPHVWLDPSLMLVVAERVGEALSSLRGIDAAAVAERTEEFAAELSGLDDRFRTALSDCDRRVFVTSHAAFGYLARAYELEQIAVAGLEPEAEPDPKRMAEIADVVRERGLTTIFTETSASPDVAETLARETGAKSAVLDPVETIPQGEDYRSIMLANLEALVSALGCS